MADLEKCASSSRIVTARNTTDDAKRLELVEIIVFETVVRALLDSGAVPNVMSVNICSPLHLEPHETNRIMKMADGTETGVVGKVTKIAITIGDLRCQMTFSVVRCAPFCSIIRRRPLCK